METRRHTLKSLFLSLLRRMLYLGTKRQTFTYLLLFACISLSMSCQTQTFRYFDVETSRNLAILTPKNHPLLPIRPANEYNMYGIKNQTKLTNEYKKRLRAVFPHPDTTLIQLLDSIDYKSVFRNDLKIYYCEYKFSPENIPSVQKIEDKLFRFFQETQTINLSNYIRIDSTYFEQSNYSFAKLGILLK